MCERDECHLQGDAMKPEVRAFKNELRNYVYYTSQLVTIGNSIEFLYERLGGVKGIDPSKEPTHALPNKELEWKLRDDISRLDTKKSRLESKIKDIDETLDLMDISIRTAVKMVYIYGKQVKLVADEFYLSSSGLAKRMDRAIEMAIKKGT